MDQNILRIDLNGVNCYLLKSKNDFILFDTGGPLFADKKTNTRCGQLVKELEKAGCKPGNLKLLVLTHGDIDHVYNAAYIREKYNAKIAIHPNDLPLVEAPSIQSFFSNFKFRSLMLKIVSKIFKKHIHTGAIKTLADYKRFTPDILIDNQFSLSAYGFDADILHIPGHTDGSIGILFKNGSFISGDTLANMPKPGTAPNASDFKTLDTSIEKLKNYNITTILPGHGNPFEFKELKI